MASDAGLEKGRRARELFREISEYNRQEDVIWKSLLAMESAGLDIALRQPELHSYLTTYAELLSKYGFDPNLSIDEERTIAVEIRVLLRRELRLKDLSPDELSRWRYEKLSFTPEKLRAGMTFKPFQDAELVDRLARELRARDPQLAKAIGLFVSHNVRVKNHQLGFPTFSFERLARERVLESDIKLPDNVLLIAVGQVAMRVYELEISDA